MVYMANALLHRRTSVDARVYGQFCGERGVYYTGVLGTSACRCVLSEGLLTWVGVYVGVCVCMRTHTLSLRMGAQGPTGRDETLRGPEESRWTKSWQICILICVQSTLVCKNAVRLDEVRTNCFFLGHIFPFEKRIEETSNTTGTNTEQT